MLELKKITKVYEIGKKKNDTYLRVDALKGISVKFRKSEFVSILGQSGCGKTTLLNIIGGLDKYTTGDLIINGKSTKEFKDKDWDTYRNHSIGFVFQSYNLIPHQTVLENVQLALTLSGISKKERERRAKDVLKKVGLKDKMHSKPNQLSGGQMQRVAIARALVNDPDIILADEPTGALDSHTSVQIMDILKEISKEKLIVMVTHNPEIANTYSSRIINLKDGELISDSNPFTEKVEKSEDSLVSMTEDKDLTRKEKLRKGKKKSMSFFTALSLSFKNLLTKKARTFLVSVAGSIGIIGIALILSLSSGFQTYIDTVQQDTLSTYPITINAATIDYTAMLEMVMSNTEPKPDNTNTSGDKIYSNDVIVTMFKNILQGAKTNDLKKFKEYLDSNEDLDKYISGIQYTYGINMNIYSFDANTNKNIQINPNNMFYEGIDVFLKSFAKKMVLDNAVLVMAAKEQLGITSQNPTDAEMAQIYALITQWDNATKNAKLAEYESQRDMLVALIPESEYEKAYTELLKQLSTASTGGTTAMDFRSLQNQDLKLWSEMIDNTELLNSQYDVLAIENGYEKSDLFSQLKYNEVVLAVDSEGNLSDYVLYGLGIKTSPSIEEVASGLVNDLNDYKVESSSFEYSEIIGKEYPILVDTDYYMMLDSNGLVVENGGTMVDIRKTIKDENVDGLLTREQYNSLVDDLVSRSDTIKVKIKAIVKPKEGVTATSISGNIGYTNELTETIANRVNAAIVAKNISEKIDTIDLSNPRSISIYCVDFESKKEIENIINKYNEGKAEEDQITYTDFVGTMMSTISTIINAISYVLIAFVSISLVVSSIMIGIITYISVLERIKEIGVLRSIGASKRDVKRVFTAESLIIGTFAGILGIVVTLVLNIPINIIIESLAGLVNVAVLPIGGAFVLIGISMLLTFIAGLIPARIASKKDPVVALRTE